jgi:thioredoxin-related protein
VIYIDVLKKENRDKAAAFRIMTIPTQVFYDKMERKLHAMSAFSIKKA